MYHSPKLFVYLLIIVVMLLSFFAHGQNSNADLTIPSSLMQTVRGRVIDLDSKTPMPGVNIVVLESSNFLGASTDMEGRFKIEDVPLGRISLKISSVGYEEKVVPNILVTSGKEVVLDIELRESLVAMDEVVIVAGKDKSQVANEMALVSARGFTVEETKRYAGSFNDPARMVSGYAGVNSDASGNNFIIVRGNSPKGILWRLEGIEIPNPNHFSDEGATGGPINALNSQMLANSEFYSGAFAPEFGNALSGVFDMSLRKGNNEQREHTFSIGVLGTDVTMEGPFKKGANSSYLVNYRYSTLSILDDLGLVNFDGIPKYQDLSFKVHLPTKSFGTFSIFGLGGISKIYQTIYDEDDEEKLHEEGEYGSNMGVAGITQYWPLSSKTFLQNSITVSQNGSNFTGDRLNDEDVMQPWWDSELNKSSLKVATTLFHKFNARHNIQLGNIYTQHYYNFFISEFDQNVETFVTDQDRKGDAGHYQGFISWKYRPWHNVSLVSGLHTQTTSLNEHYTIEPRASMKWQFHPTQAFMAGFGIHARMEPLPNYFSIIANEEGETSMPNTDMDFSKARHYVVGYENRISENLYFKAEAYYQQLYDVPVENLENSTYSLLNQAEWFTDRAVVNAGSGENTGLELTLERYFANNYYFLATTSLYDSKYKGMDGVTRDTRFNGNYTGNLLFGKEFELKTKGNKKKVIGLNTKISLLGARRYTPIDLAQSAEQGYAVFDESLAFSQRGDDVFFVNLALSYRIDRKKSSQELKIDVQNVTNNSAKIEQYYNPYAEKVEYLRQLSLLPVMMYTIHF